MKKTLSLIAAGILLSKTAFSSYVPLSGTESKVIAGPVTDDCSSEILRETQYKVKATAGSNGQVQYEQGEDNFYDEGKNLVLYAIPNQYYSFSGWTGQVNSTNNPLELTVNQAYSNLVANFTPTRTTNGVPHLWYVQHGITNDFEYHDNNDTDGDGVSGKDEYVWGSSPSDNESYPRIGISFGDSLKADFYNTDEDRRYFLDKTLSLTDANWNEITNFPGSKGISSVEIEQEEKAFYRGRARLEE